MKIIVCVKQVPDTLSLIHIFATEDQKEGMGAFLEKRKEKHFQNK